MTWKELVYMVLDELKGMSDDFTFTEDRSEEHTSELQSQR